MKLWTAVVSLIAIALPLDSLAREQRILKLRFPSFTVAPNATSEGCAFVMVPRTSPFDLGAWEIKNRTRGVSVVHSILYLYQGERLDDFKREAAGRVVLSRGCIDLGPPDRGRRQMIAAITAARGRGAMPEGVSLRLLPASGVPGGSPTGIGFLIDINWANFKDRPRRASAMVVLRAARPGRVRRLAMPFGDQTAELGLSVPPSTIGSTEVSTAVLNAAYPERPAVRDAWAPSQTACVVALAPRLHKRVRFFGVDLLDEQGVTRTPSLGTRNPFAASRTHLYGALDYTDPGLRTFAPPLLVRAGESLHYACWHDNGLARAVRYGCEEIPGTPPGVALGLPGGSPAKPCATPSPVSVDCPLSDPSRPGRSFTGACVAANLVAGETSDDEACALTGLAFDAVPGAAAGSECDVGSLPAIQ